MADSEKEKDTIYQFAVKNSEGAAVSLDKYRGQVVLVVNVASECGLTNKNYTQLKPILATYKEQGLRVAAFPCNQFGGQEPKCELDIKNFVAEKYSFEPDLYAKVEVNGKNAEPLYKFLKEKQGGTLGDFIKWNFTKFLVDKHGRVVKRYSPTTEPKSIESDIKKLLEAND